MQISRQAEHFLRLGVRLRGVTAFCSCQQKFDILKMARRFGDGLQNFVAGAALPECGRGRKVFSMLSNAVGGPVCRDKHSTLEMRDRRGAIGACRFRGRRNISCICVCVCVAGAAFGSCLTGSGVVTRAAGGPVLRAQLLTCLADFVAGAVFSVCGCVLAWQGQILVAV